MTFASDNPNDDTDENKDEVPEHLRVTRVTELQQYSSEYEQEKILNRMDSETGVAALLAL